jgi:uridine phosphorylase
VDQLRIPILEFDPATEAVIEPGQVVRAADVPECCVICFFQDVITSLLDSGRLKVIAVQNSEIGQHPVYEIAVEGRRLAVFHPGVGAALAAGLLEEVIALGCRKFIACGGAGVLDPEIVCGHPIVPIAAVRDEGTSYHYIPPGREVAPSHTALAAIERVLDRHNVAYVRGKTWTTDGYYRETRDKVRRRREEGCIAVEMEASAFFAVAEFRGVELGQILYGGDDLGSLVWDSRMWNKQASVREKLFWLAAEACFDLQT